MSHYNVFINNKDTYIADIQYCMNLYYYFIDVIFALEMYALLCIGDILLIS
jgi:hypothetical protein